MIPNIIYPPRGRGNFATNAQLGGTLGVRRDGPGPYYAAPANPAVRMPGLTGALAVRNGTACDINSFAVHMACKALQTHLGATPDGILGPKSDAAIRAYQRDRGLIVDGLIGPKTCRLMFEPAVIAAVVSLNRPHEANLKMMVLGHMTVESAFDLGAVGETTPHDLGIGQLNGPANPTLTEADRLTPAIAIPAMARIVDGNIFALRFDIDAAIAAYPLGRGGSAGWVKAGKPQNYHGMDVLSYVAKVRKAGTA